MDTGYDLVVLGSGPAGEKGAIQAAALGKRVALVEKEAVFGGAAAHTGTLPSKTLRDTALYLSGLRQRGLHGVDLGLAREADLDDFLFHAAAVSRAEHQRIAGDLARHGVQCLQGEGAFEDPHTIVVRAPTGTRRLRTEHVLIATGSSPHRPEGFVFDHERVYCSDQIVDVHMLPRTMAVVGAGVIGCEYASLFAALGTRVLLIDGRERVLPFLDAEVSTALAREMERIGVQIRLGQQVALAAAKDAGVDMELAPSGEHLMVDLVLVAAGRVPGTAALALDKAGLVPGRRGVLEVDADYRSAVPHIYAAGDVIGSHGLASTAAEQGRIAVMHMFGRKYRSALPEVLPYGIFTIPEVSMAGETEDSLKAKGVDYVVGRARLAENARGRIIGETGFLKLLFARADQKLLGVHLMAEGATELVHIGLVALLIGATAEHFLQVCFNYPTISMAYQTAAEDALAQC